MSSYEKISAYLEAHPTPWRFVWKAYAPDGVIELEQREWALERGYEQVRPDRNESCEVIVDAAGNRVLEATDSEGINGMFGGDVRALVDFVNLVGMDYEPPCGWPGVDYGPIEPVNEGPYRRRLSDADEERLDSGRKRRFTGGTVEEFLRRALSGEGE